jgi:hypothetical protein
MHGREVVSKSSLCRYYRSSVRRVQDRFPTLNAIRRILASGPSMILPFLPLCRVTLSLWLESALEPSASSVLPRSGFSASRLPLRLLLLPGRPYLISPPIDHLPAHAHLPYRGFFEHI